MLEWITNAIASLGYIGIILLMLAETFFPPISEEIIMPLAGFTAAKGELNLGLVILAGAVGSVSGALLWYALGRWIGEAHLKQFADRHGHWLALSGQDLDKSKQWFRKHGNTVVFFGRLIPGIRTYISIPAGLEAMPLISFVLYSAAGTGLWISILTISGYFLGQNFQIIEKVFGPVSSIVLIIALVTLLIWINKRKKAEPKR